MTNEEFAEWRRREFPSPFAAAKALGLDRDTITALESGVTRNGAPYPVKPYIILACAAWSMGLRAQGER